MKRRLFALAALAAVGLAAPAPAIDLPFGLFKKRQEKKEQKAEQASADKLQVSTLESDRDEGKRKAAAAALKNADPKANFDAVTALAGAVLKDPSPDVRATAAESLGGLKIMYQQAVTALEKAEADDPDKGVRAAAKAALWQYSLGGYKPSNTAKGQSAEPPLARPASKPAMPIPTPHTAAKTGTADTPFRSITQGPGSSAPFAATAEPPLAKPVSKPDPKPQPTATPTVAPPPGVPQRMPAAVPQQMPKTVESLKTVESPKAELPVVNPLPLPTVPGLPVSKPVPTVQPPK
jgi:hypothetical protein